MTFQGPPTWSSARPHQRVEDNPTDDLVATLKELLPLHDQIETRAYLRDAYLILAPTGWMRDATTVYGFDVVNSSDVDHPMLVIDPRRVGTVR